jgi:flagellar biosynthesis protein FlhG
MTGRIAENLAELRKKLDRVVTEYFKLRYRGAKVLSFPSGKGGVGKTAITINLAAALAIKGKKVLVMDLNFALPNIHMFLDEIPDATLTHYLCGETELDEIIGGVTVRDARFDVAPSESIVDLKKKIDIEKLGEAISFLKARYDYILLDPAPGLSKYVFHPVKLSDHVFIVSADVRPAYMDAMRVLKLLEASGINHEGFIVNMVKGSELKYFAAMNVFAVIPHDGHLKKAFLAGKTVFHSKIGFLSPSKKFFERMAEEIIHIFPPDA